MSPVVGTYAIGICLSQTQEKCSKNTVFFAGELGQEAWLGFALWAHKSRNYGFFETQIIAVPSLPVVFICSMYFLVAGSTANAGINISFDLKTSWINRACKGTLLVLSQRKNTALVPSLYPKEANCIDGGRISNPASLKIEIICDSNVIASTSKSHWMRTGPFGPKLNSFTSLARFSGGITLHANLDSTALFALRSTSTLDSSAVEVRVEPISPIKSIESPANSTAQKAVFTRSLRLYGRTFLSKCSSPQTPIITTMAPNTPIEIQSHENDSTVRILF